MAGDLTQLEWKRRASEWSSIEYLNSGSATIGRDQLVADCADFIEKVTRRLLACEISSSHLQSEWDLIQKTDQDERDFCATAASLGRDPYDLDEHEERLVHDVGELLGGMRSEALPALDPAAPLAGCAAIREAMEASKPNGLCLTDGLLDASDVSLHSQPPWQQGYGLARRTRKALGLDGEALASNSDLAAAIGHHPPALSRATRPVKPLAALKLVDGVVNPQGSGTVSFGLRATGMASKRFLFCRALAEEFGVSSYVIEHQVQNHRIAQVAGR